jgi:uncharacterized protein (DUF488 family)
MPGPVVLTIGHSRHPLERFLALLREHAVAAVIDVRSKPFSRFAPQYNKKALEEGLAAAGIVYRFMGRELGGFPKGDEFYDESGRMLYFRRAEDPDFQAALEEVLDLAGKEKVVLLCAEEDPGHCHRRELLGRALLARGATLAHIRGSGALEVEEALPPLADESAWRSAKPVKHSGKVRG